MSALNDSKVELIRRETVQRYKESPSSVEESLLTILDLKTSTSLQEIYQRIGEEEHPVFSRDSWISDAAARMTVDGYWTWVGKRLEEGDYSVTGSSIWKTREGLQPEPGYVPTMPPPAMPVPPQMPTPAMPFPRTVDSGAFDRAVREGSLFAQTATAMTNTAEDTLAVQIATRQSD